MKPFGSQADVAFADVAEEDSFLASQHNLIQSVIGFSHRYDVTRYVPQILTQEDLTIFDPNQVKVALELATENCVLVELKHAEDVLLKLDPHSGEVVNGVKPDQVPVRAPNKDVLFETIACLVSHRNRATDLLLIKRLNLGLFL